MFHTIMSEHCLVYIPPGWIIVENAINGGQFGVSISMAYLSIESRKNLTALSDLTLGMTVGGDAGKGITLLRDLAEAMKQAALLICDGSANPSTMGAEAAAAVAPAAAKTPDVHVGTLAQETPGVQVPTLAAAADGLDGGAVTPAAASTEVVEKSDDDSDDEKSGEPDSNKFKPTPA
jgi:hypothetical protein